MSTLVGTIVSQVCDVILEPFVGGDFTAGGGPQLGIVTVADLIGYYQVVLSDFLQQTGMRKRTFGFVQRFGIARYSMPDYANENQEVFSDETALFQTAGFDLDRANSEWQMEIDTPSQWREDRMDQKSFEVIPAPQLGGNEVFEFSGLGGYGTISAVTAVDFGITLDPASSGYGTIAADSGAVALETSNIGFGVISDLVESHTNLMVIASAGTSIPNVAMTDSVENLPDSFTHYIKYGILGKLFSTDGELKDNQRAMYCNARYLEGVNLGRTIMGEIVQQGEKQ